MKIFITGGSGICGSALLPLAYPKIIMDIKEPEYEVGDNKFILGDLNNVSVLERAMKGCDVVVHLGGSSSPLATWEDVLKNNIIASQRVFETASRLNIPKIIFASSNRVFEMYEIENAPTIYELNFDLKLNKESPVRPHSYYGVSKVVCETMGRTIAENGGPRFYTIRIGSVRCEDEDHVYADAEEGVRKKKWERNSFEYNMMLNRMKALWMSRKDLLQMVKLCIEYDGPKFDLFFGTSNNPRSWLDLEYAKNILGYKPKDNGEDISTNDK